MSFSYYPPSEPFLGHIPLWRQGLVCLVALALLPVIIVVVGGILVVSFLESIFLTDQKEER